MVLILASSKLCFNTTNTIYWWYHFVVKAGDFMSSRSSKDIYSSHRKVLLQARLQMQRAHYTEDIPDVSQYEIQMDVKQSKNNKAQKKRGRA